LVINVKNTSITNIYRKKIPNIVAQLQQQHATHPAIFLNIIYSKKLKLKEFLPF